MGWITKRWWTVTVGYALTLVFFGLFTGRVNLLFFGEHVDEVFSSYAHAAEIGQFCLLFAIGMLALSRPAQAERMVPHLALGLLVCGYSLTLHQAVGGTTMKSFVVCAGAFFGAGQGASFLGWFLAYAHMEGGRAVLSMVGSTLLSASILLVMAFVPTTAALFSMLCLVMAGCCTLLYRELGTMGTVESLPANSKDEKRSLTDVARGSWLRSWVIKERRSLLCLVAIAFVCGAQRVISLEGFLPQTSVSLLFPIGYAVGAIIFLWTHRLAENEGSYFRTYSLLLVVMATCGVFSFLQVISVQTALYAIDNVAFTIVSICMVMMTVSASHGSPCSPLVLGGLVCGAMYFSIQLGRMACNIVARLIGMDVMGALVISVIIIYVVALAAISSGVFLHQVVRHGPEGEGLSLHKPPVRAEQSSRVVVSIASVSEKQLRGNPVYRCRYGLTDREIDTLVLLLAGYNAADIGMLLGISTNTAKTHLKGVYSKTGVHNRRELISLLNEIEGALLKNEPAGLDV